MDILTASILSGLIYDGIKSGASVGFNMLKKQLKGWLIDDIEIEKLVCNLRDAGVNEDLNSQAIEKRIENSQEILKLIHSIKPNNAVTSINQNSNIGNNISNEGSGNVTVGGIIINKGDKS